MRPSAPSNPVFCALDTTDLDRAAALACAVARDGNGVKIGNELFSSNGPEGVARVTRNGEAPLFLDLKFHDIPNTVAGAVRAALPLAPFLLTVHASGGPAMMRAAAAAAREAGQARPRVVAVTLLTSLDESDLAEVGIEGPTTARVVALARLAQASGLDGVVSAPQEIAAVRAVCGPDFTLVVPGIRPAGTASGDQKRTMTPAEAMALGADYLVIGRPITEAPDPRAAAHAIARELAA
ncbi:MAG: orotidine-5'-phosphate decarboxylase [Alphaproteobacteria bacterium]|jgi:orotidine-5'-phosphate decarboxylase|nr:orotidine-5'-phosphate decarboxylase [Alphaproteobacteria bacterium]